MVIADTVNYIRSFIEKYIPDKLIDYLPKSRLTRTLLVGAVTGYLAYVIFKKRYRLPPGPRPWPLIGNTLCFKSGNLPRTFFNLSEKYGPVVTVYIGPMATIILNRIDVVNEAMLTKGSHFSDRIMFYQVKDMFYNGEDIIMGKYGSPWKLRRKIASRAIRLYMLSGNLNTKIEEAVSKTIDAMLKETEAFDPKPYLFYTVLNILAGFCFGKSYEYNDEEYLFLMNILEGQTEASSKGLFLENIFPPARLFPSKRYRKLSDIMKRFIGFIDDKVNIHKSNFVSGNINDFTDSVLQAEKDISEEGDENMSEFKHIHVVLTVFDIFFAGNETSRQTLHWALMYIIGVPGVQDKIQQEVDTVIGPHRYPTTVDRENLSYTDAVLHEVLRVASIAPFGVGHGTSCDTKLGDYDVPKGTSVIINHWGLHNDPKVWEDVDEFKPERFLETDGKMAPKPENWLPFSLGRRVCLGESMAKSELHLIIAALFQRLHISPEPGKTIDIIPNEEGLVATLKPYKIVVKKRF